MQVIARSILRLLRRRNFATGPAQCVASALPRNLSALSWPLSGGWPPALVRRRDSTRMAPPNPFGPRVFRFPTASRNMANTSGIKGQKLPKVDNGEGNGGGIVQNGKKDMKRKGANDAILLCGEGPPGEPSDNEEFACSEDEVHDSDEDFSSSEDEIHNYNCYNYPTKDGDPRCICANTFPYSMHRDGSIYKRGWSWKTYYRIANRDERFPH